jgi:hypothetical protein
MKTKDITFYLREQAALHPAMTPQDVVKHCYQAAFGAEHLLTDIERARGYFLAEYEATKENDAPLTEPIAPDVARVNLAAWKAASLPPEWLFGMFVSSVYPRQDGEALFRAYVQQAEGVVFPGFSAGQFQSYVNEYYQNGITAVHHSAAYREREKPAYRIVCGGYGRLVPVLRLMRDNPVIAIDGRAASGKTTMAAQLAAVTGAGVVHMDDFFLPADLRTPERFAQPGGNVHHERFMQEVLPNLRGGGGFSYRVFDCARMAYNGTRQVSPSPLRIVEGAYACHPTPGDYMDARVFSDVEPAEQLKRIKKRNGDEAVAAYCGRWIPLEEAYFDAYGIRKKAAIIV